MEENLILKLVLGLCNNHHRSPFNSTSFYVCFASRRGYRKNLRAADFFIFPSRALHHWWHKRKARRFRSQPTITWIRVEQVGYQWIIWSNKIWAASWKLVLCCSNIPSMMLAYMQMPNIFNSSYTRKLQLLFWRLLVAVLREKFTVSCCQTCTQKRSKRWKMELHWREGGIVRGFKHESSTRWKYFLINSIFH